MISHPTKYEPAMSNRALVTERSFFFMFNEQSKVYANGFDGIDGAILEKVLESCRFIDLWGQLINSRQKDGTLSSNL